MNIIRNHYIKIFLHPNSVATFIFVVFTSLPVQTPFAQEWPGECVVLYVDYAWTTSTNPYEGSACKLHPVIDVIAGTITEQSLVEMNVGSTISSGGYIRIDYWDKDIGGWRNKANYIKYLVHCGEAPDFPVGRPEVCPSTIDKSKSLGGHPDCYNDIN